MIKAFQRSKRVAFMATLPPPSGGEANVTKTYFESLPSFGYKLHLVDVGKRHPNFSPGKFSLYNIGRTVYHLAILIASNLTFRPGFINFMFSYSAIEKFALFVLISKGLGVRVIGQMHDPWIDQDYEKCSEARRNFIRWVFRLPNGWIVLGEKWKDFMIQATVPASRICVIPNAVKSEFAALAESQVNPIESNPPVILFTGTVGHRKGVDLLLEALVQLESEGISFKVQIVGDGELPGEREKLIEKYKQRLTPGNYEFIPHQEQQGLISLFRHARIFVLPSRAENLPVSMLEAMSCSLPVIVSRVGAVTEVVEDNVNGLLIFPERIDELKAALISLLQKPDLGKRLGKQAQHTILKGHVPSLAGKKMHIFMEQLVEKT